VNVTHEQLRQILATVAESINNQGNLQPPAEMVAGAVELAIEHSRAMELDTPEPADAREILKRLWDTSSRHQIKYNLGLTSAADYEVAKNYAIGKALKQICG
jgi:hypothetical protein